VTLESWLDLFWSLSVIAGGAVLWRLWREGMLDDFRMLAAFLAWDIIEFALLRFIPNGTTLYGGVFLAGRAVSWILSVLVALELVNLITRHYPGIATMARWLIRLSVIAAILIALLSATIDLNHKPVEFPVLVALQLVDRTVSVSVVGFIVAAVIFLLWFPVRLSRNIVAYALAFVLIYSVRVAVLLIINARGPDVSATASTLEILVSFAVYGYWILAFRQRHEAGRVAIGHAWNRTKEQRLIQQLEAINTAMLRATKQSKP
jgi:hypothetical protein